jgi:hypothetical protein
MALPKDFKTYRMYGAYKLHQTGEDPVQGEGEDQPLGGEEQEGEEGREEESPDRPAA